MDVLKVSLSNLLEKIVLVLGSERIISLKNHEEKNAKTPKVCIDRHVIFFGNNFWCHVGGSSTEGVDSIGRG